MDLKYPSIHESAKGENRGCDSDWLRNLIYSFSLTFNLLAGGILQQQVSKYPYCEILPLTAKMFDLGIDKSKQEILWGPRMMTGLFSTVHWVHQIEELRTDLSFLQSQLSLSKFQSFQGYLGMWHQPAAICCLSQSAL